MPRSLRRGDGRTEPAATAAGLPAGCVAAGSVGYRPRLSPACLPGIRAAAWRQHAGWNARRSCRCGVAGAGEEDEPGPGKQLNPGQRRRETRSPA